MVGEGAAPVVWAMGLPALPASVYKLAGRTHSLNYVLYAIGEDRRAEGNENDEQ